MKIKKSKERKTKAPIKKASASRPSDTIEKQKDDDAVKELFGVHIISNEDIENHFGVAETKSGGERSQESETPGKFKNKK